MPTIIATPGALDANSYATVAEADAYHATHLYAATWTAATQTTKEIALIMATRLLDHHYNWAEWAATIDQALQWPRDGVIAYNEREFVPTDEIPQQLKDATSEYARQLIDADRTLDNEIETQGIKALTAGSVSLSFKDSVVAKVIPDAVHFLIPDWWGYPYDSTGTRELIRS